MNEDFDTWFEDAPFVAIGGSYEFDTWLDDAPMVEQSSPEVETPRRRAAIF